jgi:hypothetical protein
VKTWLFIGHPAAGDRAAVLYSLTVSCQRHGKYPHAYFKDVLTRLPAMTNQDDLTPLLPQHWQPAPKPQVSRRPHARAFIAARLVAFTKSNYGREALAATLTIGPRLPGFEIAPRTYVIVACVGLTYAFAGALVWCGAPLGRTLSRICSLLYLSPSALRIARLGHDEPRGFSGAFQPEVGAGGRNLEISGSRLARRPAASRAK